MHQAQPKPHAQPAEPSAEDPTRKRTAGTYRGWAELLKRTLLVTEPKSVARYLAKLGEGETIESMDCVIAARGCLVRQIDAWTSGGAARFARAARDHAAQLVAARPEADQPRLQRLLADAAAHFRRVRPRSARSAPR